MKLVLHDKDRIVDDDFCEWLVSRISTKLIANLDRKKLSTWDKYINDSDEFKKLYNKTYSAEKIIYFAASKLVFNNIDGKITIELDPNVIIPGFDRLKLITFCKSLNYGSLKIKGYPIFTDTFNYFKENITQYVRNYYMI